MSFATPVLPGSRRSLRRAVSLDCGLISPFWDEVVWTPAADVSPHGLFLKTPFPLAIGDEVLVSFSPPGVRVSHELDLFGRVARASLGRRRWDAASGIGIEFVGLQSGERSALDDALRGLPPPLPPFHARRIAAEEPAWLDSVVTWEEDLDDRLNVFELLVQEEEEEAHRARPRAARRRFSRVDTRSSGRARRRARAVRR